MPVLGNWERSCLGSAGSGEDAGADSNSDAPKPGGDSDADVSVVEQHGEAGRSVRFRDSR